MRANRKKKQLEKLRPRGTSGKRRIWEGSRRSFQSAMRQKLEGMIALLMSPMTSMPEKMAPKE